MPRRKKKVRRATATSFKKKDSIAEYFVIQGNYDKADDEFARSAGILDNAAIGKKVASMLTGTTPNANDRNMPPVFQFSDIDTKLKNLLEVKMRGEETKAEESEANVVIGSSCKRHLEFQKEWLSIYDWLIFDRKKLTMQCWICRDMVESNIFATDGSDEYSLTVLQAHQESADHKNALREQKRRNAIDRRRKGLAVMKNTLKKNADPSLGSDAFDTSNQCVIFCLPLFPMPKEATVFIPSRQCRDLLQAHGLRRVVKLTKQTSPFEVRELISKAFKETFCLLNHDSLHFEYMSVIPGTAQVEKTIRPMHFDGETVIEMAGKSYIYIMAQQLLMNSHINWKEIIISHPQRMETFTDHEYKKTMLNVMHRLSCGKNKDGITLEEEEVVNALYLNFKLNTSHQLVHIGNGFDQLVLFTEQTKKDAFTLSHGDHRDLLETFTAMFKSYYWNKIISYVLKEIAACPTCSSKYADPISLPSFPIDMIVDAIVSVGEDEDVAMLLDVPKQGEVPAPFSSMPRTKNNFKTSTIDRRPYKRHKSNEDENDDSEDDTSEGDDMEYDMDFESESPKQVGVDFAHAGKVLSTMYGLQRKGMYCDFFITLLASSCNQLTKTKVFGVHKVVLAAVSPRIQKIQKSQMKISGSISCEAIQNVIEYAYTGKVSEIKSMSDDDVTCMQSAASALGMTMTEYLNKERPDVTLKTTKISLRRHPDASENKEDDVLTEECPVKKVVVEMDGFVEISKNLFFKAISPDKALPPPPVKILTVQGNNKCLETTRDKFTVTNADNCLTAGTRDTDVVLDDTSNTADSDVLSSQVISQDIKEPILFQEY